MKRVTKLKLPTNGTHTYIVTGDWHSLYCCEHTVEKLIEYGKRIPSRLIINGDFLDGEPLMKKNIQKYLVSCNTIEEKLLPQIDEEINWANNMLDRLQKVFKKIYFLSGNHEDPRYFNSEIPHAYRHNFDYPVRLGFAKRKIAFVKYNDFLEIGRTRITHGCYHGMSHLKKHKQLSPAFNMIVGHLHRHEIVAFADVDGVTKSISLPCMRDLDANYMKNIPSNWSKGFLVMNVGKDGEPHFCCMEMKKDKMILPSGKYL